tara:strand:- start:719 stop:2383 length:1665 start_codon:yes stop_codon:yes gene_type:complete
MATTFYNPYERDPSSINTPSGPAKIIKKLDIDLSPLPAASTNRYIKIGGDRGAIFNLEITNEDNYYYNFIKNVFQPTKTGLYNKVIQRSAFKTSITFPTVTDNDQYNVFLTADPLTTVHTDYYEARFKDGSLDINSSVGSNSILVKKIIYQYLNQNLIISTYSPSGTVAVESQVNKTISLSKELPSAKQAFSVSCSVSGGSSATTCYRIIRQPTEYDVIAYIEPTVGAAPVTISGENIYPAVTGTDTVDGAVSSGVKVVMDTNVATKMEVGDRITGNTALSAATVRVVALNPDGDNPKEFSMSEAIGLADGLSLSFSNQMNYQWPVNNFVDIIQEGMIVVGGNNVTDNSSVGKYEDYITILPNTYEEKEILIKALPATNTLSKKPTIVDGRITVQEGIIVFNKQQKLTLADNTLKIGGGGSSEILRVFGYDLILSDLAITLTPVTTTTTAASAGGSSTSMAVASRTGILDNVSTVSGIGINPKLTDPTVSSGAGAVSGAGTIVLDAAQSLESGTTFTFAGAGLTATITGNIEVLSAGNAAQTLRFNVDNLLSVT